MHFPVRQVQGREALLKKIVHPCVYLLAILRYSKSEFDLRGRAMHTTKIFKNGNSQAVRIPSDLAYERTDIELEIERQGEEIRIRPARRTLAKVLNKFSQFSPEFFAEGREEHDQTERDSL